MRPGFHVREPRKAHFAAIVKRIMPPTAMNVPVQTVRVCLLPHRARTPGALRMLPLYPDGEKKGLTIISERETQSNIEARLNRVFALNAHTELRQIGHDTLSYKFTAEIIQDTPCWYTTIGAKHESSMFWFREGRFWCDGHQSLRSVKWLSEKK